MISTYINDPEEAYFIYTHLNPSGASRTVKRINLCAEYLYRQGYGNHGTAENPNPFSNFNKKEKLELVAEHLERVINDFAKLQVYYDKETAAEQDAQTEFENG